MSERVWHLYRMHDAGFSGQIYAVHEPAARVAAIVKRVDDVWTCDPRTAAIYPGIAEQGAVLAEACGRGHVN